jgi:hypothetical protein
MSCDDEFAHDPVLAVAAPAVERRRRGGGRGRQRDDRQRRDEQGEVEREDVEKRGKARHDPGAEYAPHAVVTTLSR